MLQIQKKSLAEKFLKIKNFSARDFLSYILTFRVGFYPPRKVYFTFCIVLL